MSNKLLLADDSITIQKVVGIIFANEDYELTVVDNGDAAVAKARQLVPDVILVDALMPGKTGYEVCAEIRRDAALKNTPLLLLTGAFEPFDEEKARVSGADDYISKPFESQQLIERVKKLTALGKERASAAPAQPVAAEASRPAEPADVWVEPAVVATPAVGIASPANDLAEAFFVETVAVQEQPEVPTIATMAVESSPDDDLWGAFEIEEVTEVEPVEFGDVTVAVSPAVEVEEAFSFAEDDDMGIVETGPEIVDDEVRQPESGYEPVDEQIFSLEEEPVSDAAAGGSTATSDGMDFFAEPLEEAGFEVSAPVASAVDVEQQPAPGEKVAPPPEAVKSAEAVAASPVAQGGTLSEAQLQAAIAAISREVIERIVWEVVPDLAETLIKEEIRRLKEGSK